VAAQPDVKPSPLLHCERVYMRMRNEATETLETDVPMVVWEGFFTRLMQELGLSVPYYSTVRTALMEMGCIRQLRRGGGTSPSQWELLRPPTMALWSKMQESVPANGTHAMAPSVTAETKRDINALDQRVKDFGTRLDAVEKNMQYLVDLFNDSIKKGA
jgi:hypothetical protein